MDECESLDYEPPGRMEVDGPVHIHDIADFFCDFMENDRLGMICNNHLALADHMPGGVLCEECISLAEKVLIYDYYTIF
jgi:RNA-dependent RNA polymerase